uniref:BTB domain-containing protein n=1 Tax=Ciona intestinalis TaxID=7719 RepID=F6YTZ8_CIOIN
MWKRPNLKHIRSNTTQKIVLAACSGYLKDMFVAREKKQGEIINSELTKIPLLGIKPKTVDQILEAMYSTSITLSQHTVDDMLSAASFLRIPAVVAACGDFLAEMLCVKNCLRTLQVANLYSLNELLERCYSMACKNFMTVCHQKEFLKLRYCELQSLLPRQDLAVNTELNAFDAVVRWMDGDKPTRMTYAGRLMRHIRFPFIPESELVDHVEASDYVTNVPKVGDLVREAVRFHLLAHRRSIFQTARTIPRTTFKMNAIIGSGGLSLKRDGSLTDKIFYCDVTEGEWKHLANLPEPRHHHAVAVLGGYLYVAGGDSTEGWSSPSDKVWRYDLWSEEWLTVSRMKKPRESFQMAALEMKLYVVGGRVNNGVTVAEVEVYDPATNSWDEVAPISSPRRHVAVSSLSSKVYAVGGLTVFEETFKKYCPASNTWERKQPLIKPRFSASLHSIHNRLYVVGGAIGIYGAADDFQIEVYTPGTDQWSIFKGLANTRLNEAGSCSLDSKIYLVGGYSWLNRGRIDNVECVD